MFIHGILEKPEQFNDFIEVLDKDIEICNLLLEGHCATTKEFANSNLEKWRTQVRLEIEKLKFKNDEIFLVGHSMGALLLIDATLENSDKIKNLFLLAVPLSISLKIDAVVPSLKVGFGLPCNDDISKCAKTNFGIIIKSPFEAVFWHKQYLDLFKLSHYVRDNIQNLQVPTIVIQSKLDEFVSMKSLKYIKNSAVKPILLRKSRHFYYTKEERNWILKKFKSLL